ncbi:NAD-dependent epimerase/dehydratase family protein, partial [Bacillus paralicheniformis]|uniref:NAD-dependent epimerase/dehydratase family protein n=1 Tax=Bacillus paralicheniformis TaxID=1648923 RepID=UPI001646825B
MKIAISGGTGFIGRHLTNALTARGHHVYILTRKPAETEQKNTSYVLKIETKQREYETIQS